ncbi:hypothetical protein FEM48_Zijuj05G0174200 [Ziziphus jujuba var. spinosa]|uniref:Uncharacterized protein n=1 Tax=Ziziphus jujuba var. spinosa TaxID=714518 RepID=A0A978VG53_ZIZJJ|nr:hypothetical protein FEM48_Zijuj05G0174200 [Ziziphus jujuba var. spinosa]
MLDHPEKWKGYDMFGNVVLSCAIGYLPSLLKFIDLSGYQFPSFPFNSGPKQFAILNMPLLSYASSWERIQVPNHDGLPLDRFKSLAEIDVSVGRLSRMLTWNFNSAATSISDIVTYRITVRLYFNLLWCFIIS